MTGVTTTAYVAIDICQIRHIILYGGQAARVAAWSDQDSSLLRRGAGRGWGFAPPPARRDKLDANKRKRLKAAGWKVGSTRDFLGLSNEEETFVELKVALGTSLRQQRARKNISQSALAKQMGSSQSRIAKMEAGDASVSLDLQVRALVALGTTRRELARTVASSAR